MKKSITKSSRKKRWVAMKIELVRLDPQQAVLSCCDNVSRGDAAHGSPCWIMCPSAGDATVTS